MVLANVDGQPLTDPAFAPIWRAIDAKALPVLVHPTAPPGVARDGHVALPAHGVDRLHLRHLARRGAHDLRRLLRSLPQSEDHRRARRRRVAVPRSRAWTSASTTSRRAARRSRCVPSEYMPQDLRRCGRVRAGGARAVRRRRSAPTMCCTARTTRTPSATCRAACARVNGLPDAARDKVRGINARRIFEL